MIQCLQPKGITHVVYRCGGDDLLGDDFQCVHHRDVTQTSSNRQSSVSILKESRAQSLGRRIRFHIHNSSYVYESEVDVFFLTTVVALGLAPCCSNTLIMCVFPCCAAW